MANYLYSTSLYHDTSGVIGVSGSNTADLSDYTTNYQASTVKIGSLQVATTTFEIYLSYTDFKNKIASPITWTDVKEINDGKHYDLFLLTDNPV